MTEEKKRILDMVQEGKITAEEGVELLAALEEEKQGELAPKPENNSKRYLRVKIKSEKNNVNLKIPLGLFKIVSKLANMGIRMIPKSAMEEMREEGIDLSEIDFAELISLIDEGSVDGKLVDIDTEDSSDGKTKVEVYVD